MTEKLRVYVMKNGIMQIHPDEKFILKNKLLVDTMVKGMKEFDVTQVIYSIEDDGS